MTDLQESIRRTNEAREKYDECPECGEDYVGLDTTMAGDLVFVHQEEPLQTCTLQTETDHDGGADSAEM